MKRRTFAAALLVAICMAPFAQAKTYRCKLDEAGNSNWISRTVLIRHDETTGEITVRDAVVKRHVGALVSAEVAVDNAKRITYRWELKGITATGGPGRQFASGLVYRLTIQKASLKASIMMKPLGYANQFRGRGVCMET